MLPYQYYYPPVTMLPPSTLPYEEGDPIPPGYQVKTRAVRSLVIAGAITFGAPYLVSLLTGATVLAADSGDGVKTAPLFIPIAGPFVTVGTARAEGAETFWLILDGLAQTGGAVMLIYGLAADEKILKRIPVNQPQATGSSIPAVLIGPRSAAVQWAF